MLDEVKWCNGIKKNHFDKDMILTEENIKDFETADKCHVYDKKYTEEDIKVKDHCHIIGKIQRFSSPRL